MKIFDKFKKWKGRWILISSFLGLGTTGGLIPAIKTIQEKVEVRKEIMVGYPILKNRVDSLEIKTKLLETRLVDYETVKNGVIYLMEDNEILSGLLRANMEKMNDKSYGTVLVVYDQVEQKEVRRLVEVKLRKAITSKDLYVFVSSASWSQDLWGIPMTTKFAAKWQEDERKYYFIDKHGEFHLIYEVDIENTIQK